jgi:hypothetical protein
VGHPVPRNDKKAWAILHADSAARAYTLLGQGLKTLAFAPAMLCRPEWLRGVAEEAVIDSVAYQAATGTVPQKGIPTAEYKSLVRAYCWLARKYNVTADEAQAVALRNCVVRVARCAARSADGGRG